MTERGRTLASELATAVSELSPTRLPAAVVDYAKRLLLDHLGVTLAGSRTETAVRVRRTLVELGLGGDAIVLGEAGRLAPPAAALANGTAAHSIEMDDTHQGGSIHVGASVFPAALAAAALTPCSGAGFLAAVVGGYEVTARVAMALDAKLHYARGFHPTGTCGPFGAASAVAKLLGLGPDHLTWALGIAGSQGAGSMEFLATGAWTKRLHPGWAASAGVHAAMLARNGVHGPESIFEGRDGFLRAHSEAPREERLIAGLGSEFELLQTGMKPHACCRYKQGPIDALLALRTNHRFAPSDVVAIDIGMLEAGFPIVCEPVAKKATPASVVDAQFSMPFGAAVALAHGRASIEEYSDRVLADPTVRSLMSRVRCVRDPKLDAGFPRRWSAWVRVQLRDGRLLEESVEHPLGDPQNPLSWERIEAKLDLLLGRERSLPGRLREVVERLDRAPTLSSLLDVLTTARD